MKIALRALLVFVAAGLPSVTRADDVLPDFSRVPTPPFTLVEPYGVATPVLTRADVTDVPASFVADPFLFQEDGNYYMFFEVYNVSRGCGEIGLATSADGLDWRYERVVLSESFHLSFPMVFKYGDKYYMVPETYQKQEVRLYEATAFPYKWKFARTLVVGRDFVDPSIVYLNGRWWMFVGDTSNGNCFLYYADDLLGKWAEHPASPIVRNDPSKARLGGRAFVFDHDRLIRVAQKCDKWYGEKVRAFEVIALDENNYSEREIDESPVLSNEGVGWNSKGMHQFDLTWTGSNWLVASDGYKGTNDWAIGIYTSKDIPFHHVEFAHIAGVSGIGDNTDPAYVLANLIEGQNVGYETRWPYKAISPNSWSTRTVGLPSPGDYFDVNPEPIILDFRLNGRQTVEGVALWANRYAPGNSVRRFSLAFSRTGSEEGLGGVVYLTSLSEEPTNAELLSIPPVEANFIRMTIMTNDVGSAYGGDRVGLQEVAFITPASNLKGSGRKR